MWDVAEMKIKGLTHELKSLCTDKIFTDKISTSTRQNIYRQNIYKDRISTRQDNFFRKGTIHLFY